MKFFLIFFDIRRQILIFRIAGTRILRIFSKNKLLYKFFNKPFVYFYAIFKYFIDQINTRLNEYKPILKVGF